MQPGWRPALRSTSLEPDDDEYPVDDEGEDESAEESGSELGSEIATSRVTGIHSDARADAEIVSSDASSSDMDVSSSNGSLSDFHVQTTSSKRRLSSCSEDHPGQSLYSGQPSTNKRRKIFDPPAPHHEVIGLAVELWQQVFLYLSPAMLCRCLSVCRSFNKALTNTKAPSNVLKHQPGVQILESDAIWVQARKLYNPSVPRPLNRCTELQMLQLVCGKYCQYCRRAPVPSPATSPFNSGPGADGVRVIWPFGIRACGKCLELNTKKDVQVLVSPAASLRAGLPYAFLSADLHFVPEVQRSAPGGIPANIRIAKVYLNQDIETIIKQDEDATSFGDGAAEEWRKGLSTLGRQAMSDAARWEKWESQLPFGSDLSLILREYDFSSFPHQSQAAKNKTPAVNGSRSASFGNGLASLPAKPVQSLPKVAALIPKSARIPQAAKIPKLPSEIEASRQQRKADVERRCMTLLPPLLPNVLQHMESFQAAIQIPRMMTDQEWETLRPRLLGQRDAAEWIEHRRAEQYAALQAAAPPSVPASLASKASKDVGEKAYAEQQGPFRKELAEFANEYIRQQWNDATDLSKEDAPVFAAGLLLHVHQKCLADKSAGDAEAKAQALAPGSEHDTIPTEPFLSLDNMKWLFDNKVRPLTDKVRRELFICAECPRNPETPKMFAFEGLVQHYGAKHTTDFSRGNVVVHWPTVPWPDPPPFIQPEPKRPTSRSKKQRARARTRENGHGSDGGARLNQTQTPHGSSRSTENSTQRPIIPSTGAQGRNVGPTSSAAAKRQSADSVVSNNEHDISLEQKFLAEDARKVWDSLDGVTDLLDCVRVQVVLHYLVVHFYSEFDKDLRSHLDIVTDILATNDETKPIKNTHGLACSICVQSQDNQSQRNETYYARIHNVKLYSLSSLITHFKLMHKTVQADPYFNWTRNLVEVPEDKIIGELLRAPGMTDEKLRKLAAVFPHAFPKSLPRIGTIAESSKVQQGAEKGLASRVLGRLNKAKHPHISKKKRHTNGTVDQHVHENSDYPDSVPREDEYDPRRPQVAYASGHVEYDDAARYDTDLAAKPPQTQKTSTADDSDRGRAGLSGLQQKQMKVDSMNERSPSVGRVSARLETPPPVPQPVPDISSLLASLTGKIQPKEAPDMRSRDDLHRDYTESYRSLPQRDEGPYAQAPSRQVDQHDLVSRHAAETHRRVPSNQRLTAHHESTTSRLAPPIALTPTLGSGTLRHPRKDIEDALLRGVRSYEHHQHPHQRNPSPPLQLLEHHRQHRYEPERAPDSRSFTTGAMYSQPTSVSYAHAPPASYYEVPPPTHLHTAPTSHSYAPPTSYSHPPPPGHSYELPQDRRDPYSQSIQPEVRYIYLPTEAATEHQRPQQHQLQHYDDPRPHHYTRPRPIYVDEYGRELELIPIDPVSHEYLGHSSGPPAYNAPVPRSYYDPADPQPDAAYRYSRGQSYGAPHPSGYGR